MSVKESLTITYVFTTPDSGGFRSETKVPTELSPPKNCGPLSLLAHGYLVLHQTGVGIFGIKSVILNKIRIICYWKLFRRVNGGTHQYIDVKLEAITLGKQTKCSYRPNVLILIAYLPLSLASFTGVSECRLHQTFIKDMLSELSFTCLYYQEAIVNLNTYMLTNAGK